MRSARILPIVLLGGLLQACATGGAAKRPKEADPEKDPRVLMQLGDSAASRQAWLEAISYYQRSVAIDGGNAIVRNNLGLSLAAIDKLPEAESEFHQAIQINPDYADARNNLGMVLSRLGRRPEAKDEFRRAAETRTYSTPHIALFNLGRLQLEDGELDTAVESFRASTQHRPDFSAAALALGLALQKQGRLREASSQFEKCVKSFPGDCNMPYHYGTSLYETKRYEEAGTQFDKVVQLCPGLEPARKANEYLKLLRER
jgi:Flp pilus assembly protein TadD